MRKGIALTLAVSYSMYSLTPSGLVANADEEQGAGSIRVEVAIEDITSQIKDEEMLEQETYEPPRCSYS